MPGGRSALRITSNPDREIEGARYDNEAVAYLTLEDERVVWSSETVESGS